MTALIVVGYILAFLLLLLLLLLLTPVRLRAGYRAEKITLYLGVLFFRFNLSPGRPEKPARRKDKKPGAEKKKPAKKKEPAKDGAAEKPGLKELSPLIRRSGKWVRFIGRHLILYDIEIYGSIGCEDAHKTAIACGRVGALVPALLAVLSELFDVRSPAVLIAPDFTRGKSEWDVSLSLRIQPLIPLIAAAGLFITYVKHIRKKPVHGQKKRKGGHLHESAASH